MTEASEQRSEGDCDGDTATALDNLAKKLASLAAAFKRSTRSSDADAGA